MATIRLKAVNARPSGELECAEVTDEISAQREDNFASRRVSCGSEAKQSSLLGPGAPFKWLFSLIDNTYNSGRAVAVSQSCHPGAWRGLPRTRR